MMKKIVFGLAFLLAAVASGRTLHVDPLGTDGAYPTIQAAVDAVPENNREQTTIEIAGGIYDEHVLVSKRPHVRFVAKGGAEVTIRSSESVYTIKDKELPRCTALEVASDDFEAVGITFANVASSENVAAGGRGVGQAQAVMTRGDRLVFRSCRFLGHQDTLYTNAFNAQVKQPRLYFDHCYIEGTVDFIYGPALAVFDGCQIHAVLRGYLTAASTPENAPFGYLFVNCRVTGNPKEKKTILGRPWRPYAKTVFLNCQFDDVIAADGWSNWRDPEKEKTAYYAEFGCTGPGADVSKRAAWTHHDDEEGKSYFASRGKKDWYEVLAGADGWSPDRLLSVAF